MIVRRVCIVCACLFVSSASWAGTIVTWQADGQVTRSSPEFPGQPVPPPGTPLSVTLMFDPSAAFPTFGNQAGCTTVPVSATVGIGPYSYNTGPGSLGFTHALLPGSNCSPGGGFTQFSLHSIQTPPGSLWSLGTGGILIFDYRDLLVRDAFPEVPTTGPGINSSLFFTPPSGVTTWTFSGGLTLRALEQPTAVPEPGTLTLVAIGLAAAIRRRRHASE